METTNVMQMPGCGLRQLQLKQKQRRPCLNVVERVVKVQEALYDLASSFSSDLCENTSVDNTPC